MNEFASAMRIFHSRGAQEKGSNGLRWRLRAKMVPASEKADGIAAIWHPRALARGRFIYCKEGHPEKTQDAH